jgi:hypothetical protein
MLLGYAAEAIPLRGQRNWETLHVTYRVGCTMLQLAARLQPEQGGNVSPLLSAISLAWQSLL